MSLATGIRAAEGYVEVGLDDSKLLAGMRRAESRVRAFGQGLAGIGAGLLKGGLAAGAGLAFAAKSFASFESWMARTKALASPTADQFKALSDEALRLGRDTVFTATDAARTMSIFAQAGLKAGEILKATSPTLDLAATGMLDMATSADIALKVMKGMGLTVEELPAVVDVMAKAMTTANTDLVQLGEAFKFVGPVASAAGVGLHEVTAAVQILSDAGIQAEMAGTTLRGMILSLASPSDEAKKKLRELGVEVNDRATGNFRGIAAVVADLQRALAGVGTGARLEALGTIFSDRQAAGALRLVVEGAGKLLDYTRALGGAGGTAARVAATQLDTLTGSWKILESSVEGVVISVGRAVAPMLRRWGDALTDASNAVNALVERNPGLFQTLAKAAAGALVAGVAFVALGAVISGAATVFGTFASLAGGALALWYAPWFLALRNVVWAVSFLPGSAAAGGQALKGLGEAFRDVASVMAEAGAEIVRVANATWAGVADALKAGNLELAARVAFAGVKVLWYEFKDWVNRQWGDLWGGSGITAFTLAVNSAIAGIQTGLIGMGEWFANLWIDVIRGIRVAWAEFTGWLAKHTQAAIAHVNPLVTDAAAYIADNNARIDRNTAAAVSEADLTAEGSRSHVKNKSDRLRARFERERAGRAAVIQEDADRERARPTPPGQETFAARLELDALRAEAARAAQAAAQAAGPNLAGLKDRLPGVTRGLDDARAKVDVSGTFNPNAIAGLGARSVSERIADATQQTAENTKRLLDQGGGLAVT